MRTIQPTKAYRRDYRRIKSNSRYKNIDDFLNPVLEMLAQGSSRCPRLVNM